MWETEQAEAFEGLKEALVSPPVLALPVPEGEFVLDTDASGEAIGAELSQIQEGQERTIAYGSLSLSNEQRTYCATGKELLAVIRFTCMFRHYLLGRKFTLRTDHGSLRWLFGFKDPQGQLARWLESLAQYDFEIIHRPGNKHQNADALSRVKDDETDEESIQKNWKEFFEDIDNCSDLSSKKSQAQCRVVTRLQENRQQGYRKMHHWYWTDDL